MKDKYKFFIITFAFISYNDDDGVNASTFKFFSQSKSCEIKIKLLFIKNLLFHLLTFL